MAKTTTEKTLADYVAIAIGPVLIMALVGSLVFFLLEVLYVGQYTGRLQWILFFFVFGAVLIARISMQGDIADRAGLYGFILGGLVWVALLVYVEYPPGSHLAQFGWAINLFLIVVTWWSAHKLTWDCTLIDDAVDASGAGLLEAAGLEQNAQPADPPQEEAKERDKKRKKEPAGLAGWWGRYRKYRAEQARRPHAPGVWVVYFSLAALPLFGLGQVLLSADKARGAAAQRYVFFLMTVYVGSGLGLLLTTSFLGLRRYLRQRKLKMPAAVTSVWLIFGGLLIFALLTVGAFLPRPTAEYRGFLEWTGLVGSPERKASENAQEGDGTGGDKGKGAEGKGKGKDAKGEGRDGKGRVKDKDGSSSTEGKSGSGGEKGDGKGDKGKEGQKQDGNKSGKGKAAGGPKDDKKDDKKDERADGKGGEAGREREAPALPQVSETVATLFKWIVGILVALVVLFLLFRSGLRWLANFTDWARRLLETLRAWWEGLWGGGGAAAAQEEKAAERPKPRPFASFRDPFLTGQADVLTEEALVRYSFEALEAWATERGLGRQAGETPLEFAGRVGGEFPVLEGDAARLANLYASLAYAPDGLPGSDREALRQFWQVLVDAVERPMSAGAIDG